MTRSSTAALARSLYRRTSLPFRVAFKLAEFVRRRRPPQSLEQEATDRYVASHSTYTRGWLNVYGYHRVFDLVRHFPIPQAPETLQVLSIGPRTEIELYYLWLLFGFPWENVTGADLISTSDKIKLADMSVELPFKDNAFDIILACHCLEKSGNPDKTREEITRVAKPGAWVLVGGDVLTDGGSLYRELPIPCRYFKDGVYGFIDFYKLSLSDIQYMDAASPHGFEIIYRVNK